MDSNTDSTKAAEYTDLDSKPECVSEGGQEGRTPMNLEQLGWDAHFDTHFEAFRETGLLPARVTREHRQIYVVRTAAEELTAEVSGKLRHNAQRKSDFPAAGDWVAVEARPREGKATIHAVLPRRSAFTRHAAGDRTEEQVVAANIDTAFLVCGLDGDFNPRRIERYLTRAWDSGAAPVVVLNKMDMCADLPQCIEAAESAALGVPVLPVCATDSSGLDTLRAHLAPGKTVAFLGSSGVGKSTLVNALLGEERQTVHAVREDDSRGRHTTTHRELIALPSGALLIDTPGMRELQLWGDEEGLKRTFDDIDALARQCRFGDCRHGGEPGCAVQQALDEGELDAGRFRSYLKLQRELQYLERRQDQRAQLLEKAKWREIALAQRRMKKGR